MQIGGIVLEMIALSNSNWIKSRAQTVSRPAAAAAGRVIPLRRGFVSSYPCSNKLRKSMTAALARAR